MKISKLLFIPIIIFVLGLVSCSDKKTDEPEPTTPPTDTRTVLVYMVADNDLGSRGYDNLDIEEMQLAAQRGALKDGNRLLIFHSRKNEVPKLREVTADGSVIDLKEYSADISSVSASTMEQVIADVKSMAKAQEYGIVLWSHGSGWLVSSSPDQIEQKSFGVDKKRQSMNICTLANVLYDKGINFVYFDCCYMGAIEVAYELRNVTEHMVSSPTELPNNGMPYDKNVACFFNTNIEKGLIQAARNTFDTYNAMSDFNRSCTMSVVRTEGLDELAELTKQVFATTPYAYTLPEGYVPQNYMYESTCYHFDFADYIHAICTDPELLAAWDNALANVIVYENATPYMWKGYDNDRILITIRTHCGLSTYILRQPADMFTCGYNKTSWYADVVSRLQPSDPQ